MDQRASEKHDFLIALRALQLVGPDEAVTIHPLTGGVSSDIVEIVTPARRFCVKRALSRLKTAALWEAPVERNAAEAAWLRTVAAWLPDAVPAVLAEDAALGLFAMDFLPPVEFPVWKSELLDGRADQAFGAAVGSRLGTIHHCSAGNPDLARRFAHDLTFEAIRLEPYLHATGRAHPELQPWLTDLAARTMANKRALVHGDVSPKNILHGARGPVFLDAECAWYGDPAFDLAFCLNHLLLKGAYRPESKQAFLGVFLALARAYLDRVDWEPAAELERRCAALLPALLLARVDGKSPVEYLDESRREPVRKAALALIRSRPATLYVIVQAWSTTVV